MDRLITLYKASAGAGKTHTLTQEYIKLILKDEQSYKHLLAVTFTNKATDEMKQRILQELHKMASDSSNSNSEKARGVLIKILQDYPAFSVSTIDKFFQKVMRAFARELGRLVTYNVELDEKMVINHSVDNMFADLERAENRELLEWLIKFSLEKIDDGRSWKISKDITAISKNLFSEKFKMNSGNTTSLTLQEQMSAVMDLKRRILSIISEFEESCKRIGRQAVDIIEESGMVLSDFAGGGNTSPFKKFYQLSRGEKYAEALKEKVYEAYNSVGSWYANKNAKFSYKYEELYNAGLNDALGDLIALYEEGHKNYITALLLRGNIETLGILGCVYSYILEYCKENNVVLISETTEMLSRIIDGSDTPFIYEKVGTWINNFMLDEFQDTSRLQWKNFVPLLANSIASGESNLAVGDIKQSIYRFRNSDWSILHSEIESQFPGSVHQKPLKQNWRSASNIVDFNNRFFEAAAIYASDIYEPMGCNGAPSSSSRAEVIKQIYSDFVQELSPRTPQGGVVKINFINRKEQQETDIVLDNVKRLLELGYKQRDIGILVRSNSQAASIARSLMEADPNYRVISADSLTLSSSVVVKKLINILKWIDDPNNISNSIYSALEYGNVEGINLNISDWERMRGLPIYQMCEECVRCCMAESDKRDMAFIQAFLDKVLDYSMKEGSNLSGLIKWWDDGGNESSISFPDGQDAFQIMTIHKAKGLDFEVVILPYLSEQLDHLNSNQPLLWSRGASELFGYDGALPVRYSSKLKGTLFEEDYLQEKLETYIDSLNVAYVAFTRPRSELIVIADEPEEKNGVFKIESVAHLLYKFVGGPGLDSKEYILGESLKPARKEDRSDNWFELGEQFTAALDMGRMRTSLQSGSINDDLTLRDKGIIMHNLFASITTLADIEKIDDAQNRGIVSEIISSVEERGWFSDEYEVFKECTIICPDGTLSRPDRVLTKGSEAIVIDYKFGTYTPNNKKYHKQVQSYMQLLMDMGYTRVKGFLWYPLTPVIEELQIEIPL